MHVRVLHVSGPLLNRRDVVENPKAAAISGNCQIVETLLNDHPINRRMRQVALQRLPVRSIVVRNEQPAFRAEI